MPVNVNCFGGTRRFIGYKIICKCICLCIDIFNHILERRMKMKDYITSYTTGRTYSPNDVIRLVNVRQLVYYMNNGIEILDFYTSKDFKTGEDILVFIVNKKDSQEVYRKWMGYDE